MTLNPAVLTLFLDNLFLAFPEMAEDEELKQHILKNGTDYHTALETCLNEMREAETFTDAIRIRVMDMHLRAQRLERKSDAMRSLMQRLMEHACETKVVLAEATLSIRTIPPSVIINDETQIPSDYKRIKMEPNKKKIKEALEGGTEIPGAILSNGGVGLTIRCK